MEDYRKWAHNTIDLYKTKWIKSAQTISELENENKKLQSENKNQQSKYHDEYKEIISKYNILVNDYNSVNVDKIKLKEYIQEEKRKPKTTIIGGEINWKFYDSKGNSYNWSMPVTTYEEYVKYDRYSDELRLYITSIDKTIRVKDHTKYVLGHNFNNIIDSMYDNSLDDYDFLKETWYVVSNFSAYELDIGEYPRFALETFSRGSGDCEDTSILLAEMIRSSKHTKDWTVQLVYMDGYNPTNPQTVNHVLVYISNGDWGTYIETTSGSNEWGLEAWRDTPIKGVGILTFRYLKIHIQRKDITVANLNRFHLK